ncbi:MAG: hypothetical protein QOD83_1407 [Solirubrobacteraceae bacterium]|jgi:hypothetical protein|nr:hypothetical protein [Solirubrobacteraceae bacterium]
MRCLGAVAFEPVSDSIVDRFLRVEGEPVLSLAEFQSYAYGLPEDATPPALMTQWMAGADLSATELLACLRGDAVDAASGSDEALQIVRLAIERMTSLFPQLESASGANPSSGT